jgi:hypothetical protein
MDAYELARTVAQGAFDLHTHTSPSHFSRQLNDLELLKEADDLGMDGVLLKCHRGCTAARAFLANLAVNTKICRAYGSVTLNWAVGGLNPNAVDASAALGGKMVWMPTIDAENHQKGHSVSPNPLCPPLTVFDETGALKPVVYDIFDVVKSYGIFLATGHLSPKEGIALCKAGLDQGVNMIFTHPDWHGTKIDVETQAELQKQGVWLEKLWAPVTLGEIPADYLADSLKKLGPDHLFMATDHGISSLSRPNAAILDCMAAMAERGLSRRDLEVLWRDHPKAIVGAQ